MRIETDDCAKVTDAFFQLLDAHYGSSMHHVGDGDGVDEETAGRIVALYEKYGEQYWDEKNA